MSILSNVIRGLSYATPFIPGVNAFSPYIIAGAEGVASGLEGKDAAKQATAQMQAGNDQALARYDAVYAPYLNTGAQASNTLAGLMGFAPLPASSTSTPASGLPGTGARLNPDGTTTRVRPDDAPIVGHAQARGTATLQDLANVAAPAMQAQKATQSSFRRMRSPDGTEEMDVPLHAVSRLEAEGARLV